MKKINELLSMVVLAFFLVHFSACSSGSNVPQNDKEEDTGGQTEEQTEDTGEQTGDQTPEPLAEYWPTEEWRTADPEDAGMDSSKLAEVYAHFQTTDIAGAQVSPPYPSYQSVQ